MAKTSKTRRTRNVYGTRLYKLRMEQDFSSEELAAQAGVSVSTISRIENGETFSDRTWKKLMDVLNKGQTVKHRPNNNVQESSLSHAGIEVIWIDKGAIIVGAQHAKILPNGAVVVSQQKLDY